MMVGRVHRHNFFRNPILFCLVMLTARNSEITATRQWAQLKASQSEKYRRGTVFHKNGDVDVYEQWETKQSLTLTRYMETLTIKPVQRKIRKSIPPIPKLKLAKRDKHVDFYVTQSLSHWLVGSSPNVHQFIKLYKRTDRRGAHRQFIRLQAHIDQLRMDAMRECDNMFQDELVEFFDSPSMNMLSSVFERATDEPILPAVLRYLIGEGVMSADIMRRIEQLYFEVGQRCMIHFRRLLGSFIDVCIQGQLTPPGFRLKILDCDETNLFQIKFNEHVQQYGVNAIRRANQFPETAIDKFEQIKYEEEPDIATEVRLFAYDKPFQTAPVWKPTIGTRNFRKGKISLQVDRPKYTFAYGPVLLRIQSIEEAFFTTTVPISDPRVWIHLYAMANGPNDNFMTKTKGMYFMSRAISDLDWENVPLAIATKDGFVLLDKYRIVKDLPSKQLRSFRLVNYLMRNLDNLKMQYPDMPVWADVDTYASAVHEAKNALYEKFMEMEKGPRLDRLQKMIDAIEKESNKE